MSAQNEPAPTYRILAVDDDRGTLLVYRTALGSGEKVGDPASVLFEVTECTQAEPAVAEVEQSLADGRPFSVAFLDISLPPGPDGAWAAEQIRALDPDVQIVIVTGQPQADPDEIVRRAPPRDKIIYLRKPLHPLELQNAAACFCAKWEAEREVAATRSMLETRVEQTTSDLERSRERIAYQAYHDPLTGLPNRLLFNDRLSVAIAHSRRRDQGMAVLFLDLDRFKVINDSLGHANGDQVLKVVAGRLLQCVREGDTVARIGGDEFVILLQESADPNYAVAVAERILASVAEPITCCGLEYHLTTSIGITVYPDDGADSDALLANADIAMYRAKDAGRNNIKLFTQAMNDRVQARVEMEMALHRALKNGEFTLHYQPILSTASGRAVGIEALIRWTIPDGRLLQPDAFIPLAEETGLIVPLGEWVLRTACRDAVRWREDHGLDLYVSVNLSPRQFQSSNLTELVGQVLRETRLPAKALTLELTEQAVMHNVEEAITTMESLRALGVSLSMDDFGRGYSSLSHLKRFPVNTLKIDKAFVEKLMSDQRDASIVLAILSMGRSLNLDVVAEGVESPEQLRFLQDHRCDGVQGYLMAHPVPFDEVTPFLFPQEPPESD